MKKNNEVKKDILANILYIITFIIIYITLTKNNYLFASTTDFQVQHYLFPEYIRNLFYQNYTLFPDFAPNLGGGQNIYYLSYYGLQNPVILISYLFPKIKMLNYILISNCLIVLISTNLFYFFLKKNNINFKARFLTAFLFLTSGPLIFHAKRHFMFINYFPFLILGLFGIDNYLEKNKKIPLIIAITLIIYTSYYYSIPSLIALYIYSLYKRKKQNLNTNFLKHTLKIAPSFIYGILLSLPLTLPTIYTILNGREHQTTAIPLKKLLIPQINLLYNPYSIGLTLISLIALLYFTIKPKQEEKHLSIFLLILSSFPIFNYLLNLTLYINSKTLIPFIPICLYLTAQFLNQLFSDKTTTKQIIIISYLLLSSLTICIYTNKQDKLVKKEELTNQTYKTTEKLINQITKNDKTYYRINNQIYPKEMINKITNLKEYKTSLYSSTYNNTYYNFYYNILKNPKPYRNKFMITSEENIFSSILMGEKYIITKENLGLDFKLITEQNNIKVYQNKNALPLGYATNHLINESAYNKLTYPNNYLYLLNNIIVKETASNQTKEPKINPAFLNYTILNQENITITKKNQITTIKANKNANITLKINNNMKNKILLIKLHNKATPKKDIAITINHITNKLTSKNWKYNNQNETFYYTIYDNNILNIHLTKGTYILEDPITYIIDYNQIKNLKNNIDELKISSIKNDTIKGKINITNNNSYLNLSIPYDKGFKIYIDNKNIPYEKTNTSFIGFPIKKGFHQITIIYEAPYKKISLLISLITLSFLIITNIKPRKKHLIKDASFINKISR